MMDPIVAPFEERVRAVRLSRPQRPFVSTVTALPITDAEATDPGYWARHLRATVRFADAVAEVWKAPDRVLLEVGPRTTAATLARQVAGDPKKQLAISSLASSTEAAAENDALLRAAGQLWVAGVPVDLGALHDGGPPPAGPAAHLPLRAQRYWSTRRAPGCRPRAFASARRRCAAAEPVSRRSPRPVRVLLTEPRPRHLARRRRRLRRPARAQVAAASGAPPQPSGSVAAAPPHRPPREPP